MLIPPCVSEAVLPARSLHVPVTDCPAPSEVRVWLTVSVTGPETESLHVQLAVTSVLFQPLAFGAVRPVNVMVGFIMVVASGEKLKFAIGNG